MTQTSYDFAGKYTRPNPIAAVMLEGFFGAVEELFHVALAGHKSPARILEVGCGEGFSTRRYRMNAPADADFAACDVEDRLVEAARVKNPGMQIDQASIYELPYESGSRDLVLATEVLEHIDDPARGLAELVRVSRRYVLVSVPREPLWRALNMARGKYLGAFGNTPGHIQHWSTKSFTGFVGGTARVAQVRTPIPWTIVLAEKR